MNVLQQGSTWSRHLDTPPGGTPMISIDSVKIILTLSILLMGMCSVFAPRKLTGKPWIFSLGNMMASGVLLSAGLVHQLAESASTLNHPDEFPWAMFICGLTFLTFMVVEESLHLLLGGQDQHYTEESSALNASNLHEMMHGGHSHDHRNRRHHHHHHHGHEEEDSHGEEEHSGRNLVNENQPLLSVRQAYSDFGASTSESCSHLPVSCTTHMDETTRHTAHEGLSTNSSHRQHRQFGSFLQSTKTHKEDPYQLQEHHHHDDHIDLHLHGSILASSILMLALSIHSILAGVSIGIEKDLDGIAGTAIAILAHKSFEGFCLGSSLVNAQMDHLPFLILGISFSCATPLGILIGQFIMGAMVPDDGSTTSSGVTTIAVVQAIVAGTFLYIAIVEIGSKELLACRHELSSDAGGENSRHTIQLWKARLEVGKLLCFVFGFLAMSALAAVV